MSGQVISKTQKGRAFPHHTAGDSLNQSLNISGWSDKLEFADAAYFFQFYTLCNLSIRHPAFRLGAV